MTDSDYSVHYKIHINDYDMEPRIVKYVILFGNPIAPTAHRLRATLPRKLLHKVSITRAAPKDIEEQQSQNVSLKPTQVIILISY